MYHDRITKVGIYKIDTLDIITCIHPKAHFSFCPHAASSLLVSLPTKWVGSYNAIQLLGNLYVRLTAVLICRISSWGSCHFILKPALMPKWHYDVQYLVNNPLLHDFWWLLCIIDPKSTVQQGLGALDLRPLRYCIYLMTPNPNSVNQLYILRCVNFWSVHSELPNVNNLLEWWARVLFVCVHVTYIVEQ